MENLIISLGSSFCTITPDRVTIVPNSRLTGIGSHITVDKLKQMITIQDQIFILNRVLNLMKTNYQFADVYRLGKQRTDTKVAEAVHTRRGNYSHVEEYHIINYDLIMYLKSGKQVKVAGIEQRFAPEIIAPMSLEGWDALLASEKRRAMFAAPIDGYVLLEIMLHEMIDLPDEY